MVRTQAGKVIERSLLGCSQKDLCFALSHVAFWFSQFISPIGFLSLGIK